MTNQLSASIQIAAQALKDRIPKEGTLIDRLRFAMRDVLAPNSGSAFMCGTEEEMFKGAVGGVLLSCSPEEHARITVALQGLAAIAALQAGIPVDLAAVEIPEDPLPLLGMWHEVKEEMRRG